MIALRLLLVVALVAATKASIADRVVPEEDEAKFAKEGISDDARQRRSVNKASGSIGELLAPEPQLVDQKIPYTRYHSGIRRNTLWGNLPMVGLHDFGTSVGGTVQVKQNYVGSEIPMPAKGASQAMLKGMGQNQGEHPVGTYLNWGARFFDFRLTTYNGPNLQFQHGPLIFTGKAVEQVLAEIQHWRNRAPGSQDLIVIGVQKCDGKGCSTYLDQMLQRLGLQSMYACNQQGPQGHHTVQEVIDRFTNGQGILIAQYGSTPNFNYRNNGYCSVAGGWDSSMTCTKDYSELIQTEAAGISKYLPSLPLKGPCHASNWECHIGQHTARPRSHLQEQLNWGAQGVSLASGNSIKVTNAYWESDLTKSHFQKCYFANQGQTLYQNVAKSQINSHLIPPLLRMFRSQGKKFSVVLVDWFEIGREPLIDAVVELARQYK